MSKIKIEHIEDDIENLEIGGEFRGVTPEYLLKILRELKRSYERENALVSAIKELCDSEDSTDRKGDSLLLKGCSGDLTVVSLDPMLKLYELTSE